MSQSRQKQIEQRGSPSYTVYPGVISAGDVKYYDLEEESGDARLKGVSNYLPLDFIHVINNDVVDIEVTINGTKQFYYPSGLAQSITDIKIHSVAIKNMDIITEATANKISVAMRRKPVDTDSMARKLKGLF